MRYLDAWASGGQYEPADLAETILPEASTVPATSRENAAQESRFRVQREHARGGLGVVSVAVDQELNREIVVKEIRHELSEMPEQKELQESYLDLAMKYLNKTAQQGYFSDPRAVDSLRKSLDFKILGDRPEYKTLRAKVLVGGL